MKVNFSYEEKKNRIRTKIRSIIYESPKNFLEKKVFFKAVIYLLQKSPLNPI